MNLLLLFLLVPWNITASAIPLVPSWEAQRSGTDGFENGMTASITRRVNRQASVPARLCGTERPSPGLLQLHGWLKRKRLEKRAPPSARLFTVNTYFHIVSAKENAISVSKAMIANQIGTLQAAYASSNISFNLVDVDYSVNDTWATDENDADMKLALRKGNYSALNIYFQTNLSTTAYGLPTQLLGYCTLPTNVTYLPCENGCFPKEFPAANYAMDGCNILAPSMPGGELQYYNLGITAVHEVGHWFGLLHTFQDNSCDPASPGDFIADTPQESVSTDGCPKGKDSCPSLPGLDPIHNYMDYSTVRPNLLVLY